MNRNARIAGGIALWLGALIIGFYFSTGSGGSDPDREALEALAATATSTTAAVEAGPTTTSTTQPPPTTTVATTTTTTSPPTTTTTTQPPTPTTELVATLDGGRFSLSGVVPDEAAAQRLITSAGIVYGPDIAADLEITPDVEVAPWFDGAARTITLLPMIGQGSITITADGVSVSGTAPNEPLLTAFQQAVALSLGVSDVAGTVEITNLGFPSFHPRRLGGSVVLTGELASEAAKANILTGAIAVYGQDAVDDQLTIGTDLDTPFWTYTLPGVFQLLAPFPDYEINIENGVTSGSLNAGANFDSGSAELKPETEALLAVAVAILTRDPTLGMEIAGHTDSNGSDVFNQRLSEARAQSAADFLIAAGIAAERLRPVGYGETQPIASNDTNAGRELNRRVEFSFGPASVILAP